MLTLLLIATLFLSTVAFFLGRERAVAVAGGRWVNLRSLPGHYGYYVALWTGLPAFGLGALLLYADAALLEGEAAGSSDRSAVAVGLALAVAVAGLTWSRGRIVAGFAAREAVERLIRGALFLSSGIAILTTIGIVLSLLFEALRFFQLVSPAEFFLGLKWSPQTALRADQVGASGAFGAVPVFAGTLLITVIAMFVVESVMRVMPSKQNSQRFPAVRRRVPRFLQRWSSMRRSSRCCLRSQLCAVSISVSSARGTRTLVG